MDKNLKNYWFGANWRNFVRFHFNEKSLIHAKPRFQELFEPISVQGKSLLDVGCGSGIHSLVALDFGASQVVSIDIDEDSVRATSEIKRKFGKDFHQKWKVQRTSILDDSAVESLGKFDVVYAWGSLHHTGDVWRAIRNAANCVSDDGYLALALYSRDVTPVPSHEFWMEKKKVYVTSGFLKRRAFEIWYVWRFYMNKRAWNLFKVSKRFRNHKRDRGMSLLVDVRDWLGGWPMEFVGDKEVQVFLKNLNFSLIKMITGKANTEFVFKKN